MAPLPPQLPESRRDIPHIVSAYNLCLNLEFSLVNGLAGANKMDLIFARILGFLLHFVPTHVALKAVADEIVSARSDNDLIAIGKMYYDHYIRAFRASKRRTPIPSNHSSRRSFDTVADMINDTLNEAPQSHATAKKKALIRDGYRCVVTGAYDTGSLAKIRELKTTISNITDAKKHISHCAHIFSESTNMDIEPGGNKRQYASTMWAVMNRHGYTDLPEELNGAKIHRLENVMTLSTSIHGYFDQLLLWFLPTDVENKYKVHAVDPMYLWDCLEYVTFTTPDPVVYPLPSPQYLAIHATCAQVAHLSGAASCIDKFFEDEDDSTTMDPHGASAELLENAIIDLQAAGYPIAV